MCGAPEAGEEICSQEEGGGQLGQMLPRRSRWSGGDGDLTIGLSNTGVIGDLAKQFWWTVG